MIAPFVTVLITTYNYGRFIEQAIESVLSQEYPGDRVQIVVVDDGSTDDTREVVKKYGSRIEYYLKENGGQGTALNLGFEKANGEIVALLDADDLFLSEKLRRIGEAFGRDPRLGMVYHQTREWYPESGEYREYEFFPVSGDLHKEPGRFIYYIPQPTTCVSFRRSCVAPLLPIPERIRMNADCFLVALIPFLSPVLALPEVLSTYRIHGRNSFYPWERQTSLETRQIRKRVWQTVIEEMSDWLASHGYTRKFAPARAFLDRWNILIQTEAFAIDPPSRVQFFTYLLKCYRYRLPLMPWKLALINCVDAMAALFVGYKNFPQWIKRREELLNFVRR